MWINHFAMVNDNHATGTPFSKTDPKFMTALLGPTRNTIYLQRGYRQFGQPLESTLDAFVEVNTDESDPSFANHL